MSTRFGANGIYTDLRILVPLFVMAMILVLGWQYRNPAGTAASIVAEQEMARAMDGLTDLGLAPEAPRPAPAAPKARSDGPSLVQTLLAAPPIVYAVGAGLGIAGLGALGAIGLLRRGEAEASPSE